MGAQSTLLPLGAALALLAACGERPAAPRAKDAPTEAAVVAVADPVVARIGERTITAAEADAPLRLTLHDLAMQKHRLRRQALESQLLRALETAPAAERSAEMLLIPPVPPRENLSADPARTRPSGDAPVTILAFCNFESPHCARLQVTLSQVLPLFPGVTRYAERDLPLDFHRHAAKAAEAARCANDQGAYWRFHDLLYASGGIPDRAALDRTARSADLDVATFTACLDGGQHAAQVAADAGSAQSLGLSVVPAVFVNGLYASPDVQPADLVGLIEFELAARGATSPRLQPAQSQSTARLQLQGLIASPHAGQGLALLAPAKAPGQVHGYREGDAISSGVILRRIGHNRIELLHDGRAEWLGLGAAPPSAGPAAAEPQDDTLAVVPHRAVPVTLDRDQVLVLLSDRIALAAALQPVPMTAGGHHLLRVQEVAPGSLYELLGFEPGDVIVGVNEQPIHEGSNPLWDALEKEGEVRVRVMRRGGLARHFTYRFED